ncbi:hypothetical protein OA57_07910 [Chelonobacter oris]|uniref:Uncharacterized protein n=1 Tax=Chelonobacter oris TaxID=505317 RepID=A0A0A3B8T5_9PAST|nr:hypothetical protein [Chelonobacter oris]KGQ69994.1 hypothetical protein OA57_07910 [Chelonobacter oris]
MSDLFEMLFDSDNPVGVKVAVFSVLIALIGAAGWLLFFTVSLAAEYSALLATAVTLGIIAIGVVIAPAIGIALAAIAGVAGLLAQGVVSLITYIRQRQNTRA